MNLSRRPAALVLAGLALVTVTISPAAAYPRPGSTLRLSQSSEGQEGGAYSRAGVVSADGSVVAFASMAPNLIPGDTNATLDVFAHDLTTGRLERISVDSQGEQANGPSFLPSVSRDGRFVAYASKASNLSPGDAGPSQDVFLHDRNSGRTERITRLAAGDPTAEYWTPKISGDGSRVAFYEHLPSTATEFTRRQVFVHDLTTGETVLVSKSNAGVQANNLAHESDLSADGRYVAFSSGANNLVPGDTNSAEDVFIHDTEMATTELVSVSSSGAQGNAWALEPSVSGDGRYVAFSSAATTFVPGDTSDLWDVFVRDRATGTTERVSVSSAGSEGDGRSSSAQISDDGRVVVFVSHATNLAANDDNATNDVFAYDRIAGSTRVISVAADGGFPNRSSFAPDVSADGGVFPFGSIATDLVPAGGTSGRDHSFVRLHGPSLGVSRVQIEQMENELAVSGWATFSGEVVAEASDAADDAPLGLGSAGGEVVGAAVVYRPEEEELLLRWRLADVPEVLGHAGVPGVVFVASFTAGGEVFRVRGTAPGVFVLERCAPACIPESQLQGSVGSAGRESRAVVPLSSLGAVEGTSLEGVLFSAALGAPEGPSDEATLPNRAIPRRAVALGVAQADALEEEVVFTEEASLTGGTFSGRVAIVPQGEDRALWIRGCLGGGCRAVKRLLAS